MRRLLGILLLLSILALPVLVVVSRGAAPARPQVALIEITGFLEDAAGESLWSGTSTGARDVVDHLRTAQENPRFAAVVLRINSPGGSPAAAQEIYGAVRRTRDAGKPVVVSMGDAALSAAYYAAAAADAIVANPGTLTGSLGAVVELILYGGLLERYGVTAEIIASGPYKDVGNPFRPLEPREREWLQGLVNELLDQFVADVAAGRRMEVEAVRRLADGRAFTGRQALEVGLIDRLGGFEDAVALAAQLAGLEGRPNVVPLRKSRSFYDRLLNTAGAYLGRALAWPAAVRLLDDRAEGRSLYWLPVDLPGGWPSRPRLRLAFPLPAGG